MDNFKINRSVDENKLGRFEDFVQLMKADFRPTCTPKSESTSHATKSLSVQFKMAYRNALSLFCESQQIHKLCEQNAYILNVTVRGTKVY